MVYDSLRSTSNFDFSVLRNIYNVNSLLCSNTSYFDESTIDPSSAPVDNYHIRYSIVRTYTVCIGAD